MQKETFNTGSFVGTQKLQTNHQWDDLVLNKETQAAIDEVNQWMRKKEIAKKEARAGSEKNGLMVLFHGPSGTGKTLTASLLGKQYGAEVYQVDLSMVASKYIGETEKNLERLFATAESKGWILYFDEADALFGKRTDVKDSHDRYANIEVNYMLSRLESFNGLAIVATNNKKNIDDAFTRRFNTIIHFPLPDVQERALLWQKILPETFRKQGISASELAKQHELSAGAISNAVRYASAQASARQEGQFLQKDLFDAIQKVSVRKP